MCFYENTTIGCIEQMFTSLAKPLLRYVSGIIWTIMSQWHSKARILRTTETLLFPREFKLKCSREHACSFVGVGESIVFTAGYHFEVLVKLGFFLRSQKLSLWQA